jgi:hypothetical protein
MRKTEFACWLELIALEPVWVLWCLPVGADAASISCDIIHDYFYLVNFIVHFKVAVLLPVYETTA